MERKHWITFGIVAVMLVSFGLIGNFALTGQATGGGGCGGEPDDTMAEDGADGSAPEQSRRGGEDAPEWPGAVREPSERCDDYSAERRALFGDLHIHTSYSLDAYGFGTRATPEQALRFAQGFQGEIGPYTSCDRRGENCVPAREDPNIQYRALDFVGITDHSEFFGEVRLCTDPDQPGYNHPWCRNVRNYNEVEERADFNTSFVAGVLRLTSGQEVPLHRQFKGEVDQLRVTVWGDIRRFNNEVYFGSDDRDGTRCGFTALHGYEWSAMEQGREDTDVTNMHRNVIFRNDHLPPNVVSFGTDDHDPNSSAPTAATWQRLLARLETDYGCIPAGRYSPGGQLAGQPIPDDRCVFMAIPHNMNFGHGVMHRDICYDWCAGEDGVKPPVGPYGVDPGEEGAIESEMESARALRACLDACEHETNSDDVRQLAIQRAELEPIAEVFQVKQDSMCRLGYEDPAYPEVPDEFCNFEKMHWNTPLQRSCEIDDETCVPICTEPELQLASGTCETPTDSVRNILKSGLRQSEQYGVNPFEIGLIGSTDTHNATPGLTDELGPSELGNRPEPQGIGSPGSHGRADYDLNRQVRIFPELPTEGMGATPNLGGLAVVWAEQNTRHSVFDALVRRETYATSGTRLVVRFFGGEDLDRSLCGDAEPNPNMVRMAYERGVPMGGRLTSDGPPSFLVDATFDPRSARLNRMQIIKVWLSPETLEVDGRPADDPHGPRRVTHERIYDVMGDEWHRGRQSPSVDLDSCVPDHGGYTDTHLCGVWTDPDFDPNVPAAYYARVVENPWCRWTQWQCVREIDGRGNGNRIIDGDELQNYCAENGGPNQRDHWDGRGRPEEGGFESRLPNVCCLPRPNQPPQEGDHPFAIVQERAWTSPIYYVPTR